MEHWDGYEVLMTPRQLDAGFPSAIDPTTPGTPDIYSVSRSARLPDGAFPQDLPPPLGPGSSSPVYESPRTVRNHNRILNPYQLGKYGSSLSPIRNDLRFPLLPSSPPDHVPNTQQSRPVPSSETTWTGRTLPKKRAALVEDSETSDKGETLGTHKGLSLLLSPGTNIKRSLDEAFTEYSITGSNFGFVIDDSTGRAEVSPLKRKQIKLNYLSQEGALGDDSDSDSDREPEDNVAVEGDALDAFTRILARSRVGCLPNRKKMSHVEPHNDQSFFVPVSGGDPYQFAPTTPKNHSTLRFVTSTPYIDPITATPPGAVLTADSGHMFSTGMTPYLPRS